MVRVLWGGIASRAHIVYGASWLRQFGEPVRVAVAEPRGFLHAGQLTLDDVAQMLPDGITAEPWTAKTDVNSVEALLSVGAVGIKPWLRTRRGIGLRRLTVVVTDEGLGSYGGWVTRRAAWRREGIREPWLSLRTTAVVGATRVLTSKRWATYAVRDGRWAVRPVIADEFRRHARRTPGPPTAVFLSQPWPELGVISEPEYLEHVAAAAGVAQRHGLDFSVHPHPAEPAERYATWPTHRGLAELTQAAVNASVVLGATSTAMLNLAAIHGVPALRIAPRPVEALDEGLSRAQATLLRQYLGQTVPMRQWHSKLARLAVDERTPE